MRREGMSYWHRSRGGRFTRRRVLQGGGALGAGAAGLALVGCGNDDDDDDAAPPPDDDDDLEPTPTPDPSEVRMGGHLNLRLSGSPRSLDFHFDTFPFNSLPISTVYDGLLRFSEDWSEIRTELATDLPENPDELTWVFNIRDDVFWQDVDPVNGRKLTSEDVKFSIERQMTDDPGTFQHAYFFLGHVTNIETPDEHTVVFNTQAPFAPFLSYIASPWTLIAPPEAIDAWGDLTENAAGSGPFIFEEWEHDVAIRLRKNPNYWKRDDAGNALPYVDSVDWNIVTDGDTGATMFIDRQIDATVLGEAQFQRVLDARDDVRYEVTPAQFWRQMRMQPTMEDQPYRPPFDDVRVRQAIVQAQDAMDILDLVYNGDGILTYGASLPIYEFWALHDFVPGSEPDVANALALLEAAGNPDISGDLIWASTDPQVDQVAEIHQQHLAEIGVDVRLQPMELGPYYNQTYQYDYTFSSHTPLNSPDPDENLASYFGRDATFFRHYNPEIFELIAKQATILDPEERRVAVLEAERAIVLDFPMKFLYTTNFHNFVSDRVRGWFWNMDLYEGRGLERAWIEDA